MGAIPRRCTSVKSAVPRGRVHNYMSSMSRVDDGLFVFQDALNHMPDRTGEPVVPFRWVWFSPTSNAQVEILPVQSEGRSLSITWDGDRSLAAVDLHSWSSRRPHTEGAVYEGEGGVPEVQHN